MTKFERKTQENPDGGSVEREVSIHYSNVMSTEKSGEKSSRTQWCASLLVVFRRSTPAASYILQKTDFWQP
jgi:hypothetical protein